MLIRIVKMTFDPSKTEDFRSIYNTTHEKIRNVSGCRLLELYQDSNDSSIFMTYSYWESEEALERYRKSELFRTTWAKTKLLFSKKPEAWSLKKMDNNNE